MLSGLLRKVNKDISERGWCVSFERYTEVSKGLLMIWIYTTSWLLKAQNIIKDHHWQQQTILPANPEHTCSLFWKCSCRSNRKFDTINGKLWHPSSGNSYNSQKYFQLFLSFYIWPSVKGNHILLPVLRQIKSYIYISQCIPKAAFRINTKKNILWFLWSKIANS